MTQAVMFCGASAEQQYICCPSKLAHQLNNSAKRSSSVRNHVTASFRTPDASWMPNDRFHVHGRTVCNAASCHVVWNPFLARRKKQSTKSHNSSCTPSSHNFSYFHTAENRKHLVAIPHPCCRSAMLPQYLFEPKMLPNSSQLFSNTAWVAPRRSTQLVMIKTAHFGTTPFSQRFGLTPTGRYCGGQLLLIYWTPPAPCFTCSEKQLPIDDHRTAKAKHRSPHSPKGSPCPEAPSREDSEPICEYVGSLFYMVLLRAWDGIWGVGRSKGHYVWNLQVRFDLFLVITEWPAATRFTPTGWPML